MADRHIAGKVQQSFIHKMCIRDRITGYVKSEYILTGQQAEDKAMQVAKLMAIANTDGVNVRSEPNTESRIWTQIASSEKFLVVSQQDGWVEIELDDSTAFISSDYVDVKYGLNEAIPYTCLLYTSRYTSKSSSLILKDLLSI